MVNIKWQPGMTLEAVEKEVILQCFRYYKGNRKNAAQALGISDKTIYNKIEQYQAEGKAKEDAVALADEERRAWALRARFGANGKAGRNPVDRIPSDAFADAVADEAAAGVQDGDDSQPGMGMESAPGLPPKQTVPVPLGKEVQGLPPRKAPADGAEPVSKAVPGTARKG